MPIKKYKNDPNIKSEFVEKHNIELLTSKAEINYQHLSVFKPEFFHIGLIVFQKIYLVNSNMLYFI